LARILFFTPVLPGPTGQGTAIRAGIALELLAEKHEVTLVHIDLWTGDRTIADPFWPRRLAACHFVPAPPAADAASQLVKQHLSAAPFDAVYVFRLVAAPFALSVVTLLAQPPRISVLDLDDDECARTERFLALRGGGDSARERAELNRLRGFARIMLMRFDLALLAAQWLDEGLPADFPCVLVSRAAQPDQQVQTTTLGLLGEAETAQAPSLLIAGWAVREVAPAALAKASAFHVTALATNSN